MDDPTLIAFRKLMADQLYALISGTVIFRDSREVVSSWWQELPEKEEALKLVIREEVMKIRFQCEELFTEIPVILL